MRRHRTQLTYQEAARYVGHSTKWLERRKKNGLLPFVLSGKTVLFERADLDALVAAKRDLTVALQISVLTEEEVSQIVSSPPKLLRTLSRQKKFPTPIRVGPLYRWRAEDIEAFVAGSWKP